MDVEYNGFLPNEDDEEFVVHRMAGADANLLIRFVHNSASSEIQGAWNRYCI